MVNAFQRHTDDCLVRCNVRLRPYRLIVDRMSLLFLVPTNECVWLPYYGTHATPVRLDHERGIVKYVTVTELSSLACCTHVGHNLTQCSAGASVAQADERCQSRNSGRIKRRIGPWYHVPSS